MDTKTIIGLLVRHLIPGVTGWIAVNGGISVEQVTTTLAIVISVVVSIGWSFIQKIGVDEKIDVALNLPQGSTREDLLDALDENGS